jgi:hypothetical protein
MIGQRIRTQDGKKLERLLRMLEKKMWRRCFLAEDFPEKYSFQLGGLTRM